MGKRTLNNNHSTVNGSSFSLMFIKCTFKQARFMYSFVYVPFKCSRSVWNDQYYLLSKKPTLALLFKKIVVSWWCTIVKISKHFALCVFGCWALDTIWFQQYHYYSWESSFFATLRCRWVAFLVRVITASCTGEVPAQKSHFGQLIRLVELQG